MPPYKKKALPKISGRGHHYDWPPVGHKNKVILTGLLDKKMAIELYRRENFTSSFMIMKISYQLL